MLTFLHKQDTLLPSRPNGRCFTENEGLVVYLRLRIVSITLTSTVPDVLDVLDVVVGGGGSSALPPVGILPAKIGVDSAHMSASAIANRFMVVAPF